VYVQAEANARQNAENLNSFYVANNKGQMVPLSAVTTIKPISGPEFTMRFNEYRAAQLNVTAAPGVSSGQAMAALEDVFKETMPSQMGFDYMGMSYQEQEASKGVPTWVVFGLSLMFVFLILAALYESWSLPFSVLLSTPIAVFGAFLALWIRNYENDVYTQIGLIMLIGLSAKNAILIVEYAKDEFEHGKSVIDAALTAARIRFRPILMTAFAFILGCVPLWTATGSGAVSRRVLGTAVIGGMLAATLISIFLIPVMFDIVEGLSTRFSKKKAVENEAPVPEPAGGVR
jgi:HAE1 family hydrophobic/amphiphilic exporter-1